jgi:hypothetical protein
MASSDARRRVRARTGFAGRLWRHVPMTLGGLPTPWSWPCAGSISRRSRTRSVGHPRTKQSPDPAGFDQCDGGSADHRSALDGSLPGVTAVSRAATKSKIPSAMKHDAPSKVQRRAHRPSACRHGIRHQAQTGDQAKPVHKQEQVRCESFYPPSAPADPDGNATNPKRNEPDQMLGPSARLGCLESVTWFRNRIHFSDFSDGSLEPGLRNRVY